MFINFDKTEQLFFIAWCFLFGEICFVIFISKIDSQIRVGFPPAGALSVILCSMLVVLFVSQIFIVICFSFILESCKNRSIKLDFTSAHSASESSFLSKSDTCLCSSSGVSAARHPPTLERGRG